MDINKAIISNINPNNEQNNDINDMQRPDTLGAIDLKTNRSVNITSYILTQPIGITGPTIDSNLLSAHWTRMMAEGDDQLSTSSSALTIQPSINMQNTSQPINNLTISSDNMQNMQMISNHINNLQLNFENNMYNRGEVRSNHNNMQINCDNVVTNSEIRIGNFSNLGRRTRAAGMDEIEMRQRLTPSSLEAEGWSDCESNGSNNPRERTYSDEIDGLTEATEADQYKMNPEADQTFGTQDLPNRPRHVHDINSIINTEVPSLIPIPEQHNFINQNCENKITQRHRLLNINDINIETEPLLDDESPQNRDNYRTTQGFNYGQPLTDTSLKNINISTIGLFSQNVNNSIFDSNNISMQSKIYQNQVSLISNNGRDKQNNLSNENSFYSQPLIQNFDLLNAHNISMNSLIHDNISEISPNLKHQSKFNDSNAFKFGDSIISNDHDLAQNLYNKGSNFIKISKLVPTYKLNNDQIIPSHAQPPSYANSIGAYDPINQQSKMDVSNAKISIGCPIPSIPFNTNFSQTCAPILSDNLNSVNDKVSFSLTNNIYGNSKTFASDFIVNSIDKKLNKETVLSLLTNAITPYKNDSNQFNNDIATQNIHDKNDFRKQYKDIRDLQMPDGVIANFDILGQGDMNLFANFDPLKTNKEFSDDHIFIENLVYNNKNNSQNIYTNNMNLSHDSLESSFNEGNRIIETNDNNITSKYNNNPINFSPISNIPHSELKKYEKLVRPIAHVGTSQGQKKFNLNVHNTQNFSNKYKNNFDDKVPNPFEAYNIEYSNRPNTAPNPTLVDNFKERISSSLSDKINKELNIDKMNINIRDSNTSKDINDRIFDFKLDANKVRTNYDRMLSGENLLNSPNKKLAKSKIHKPDLLHLENKDEIELRKVDILKSDYSAYLVDSLGYKYKQGNTTKLLANQEFLANIKLLNNEKTRSYYGEEKNKPSNSLEKYKLVNEDSENIGSRVLMDKLSEERLKREFCEEEIQQLQMVRLKQQQELTVLYNENKIQKETISKINNTLEKLYMESQKMKSNYESSINQYCEQFSLLDNYLKETKEKLSKSSFDLVSNNQKIHNLEFLLMEKENQFKDIHTKFGKLQEEYANEVKNVQTILDEKKRTIDDLKIDFEKQMLLTIRQGDTLLSDERFKMNSEIKARELKLYELENQVKVKNDKLEESISANLILEGKFMDFMSKNKKIQLELKFIKTEKSEMMKEIEKIRIHVKEDVTNIEIKMEELKSDYQKKLNELSIQHINEMSVLKTECEDQLKGERMLAQQSIIKMEQEFEDVLTRSAIDARDLETKLNQILSENNWLRELRDKSAIVLQKLMKQHCDEALQVLYFEQFENTSKPIRMNQWHLKANHETEPLRKKEDRLKENKSEKEYSEINQIMGTRLPRNIDLSTRTIHSQPKNLNDFQLKESKQKVSENMHGFDEVKQAQHKQVKHKKREDQCVDKHNIDLQHREVQRSEIIKTQQKINIGQMWPGDLHWKGNSDDSLIIDHNDSTQMTKYVNYDNDRTKSNNDYYINETNSYANGDSNNDFSSSSSSVLLDELDSNRQIGLLELECYDNKQIKSKEIGSEGLILQNLDNLKHGISNAASSAIISNSNSNQKKMVYDNPAVSCVKSILNNVSSVNTSTKNYQAITTTATSMFDEESIKSVDEQSIKSVGGQYSQFLTKIAQFRPNVDSLNHTIQYLKQNVNGFSLNETTNHTQDSKLTNVESIKNSLASSFGNDVENNFIDLNKEVRTDVRHVESIHDTKIDVCKLQLNDDENLLNKNLKDNSLITKNNKKLVKREPVTKQASKECHSLNGKTATNFNSDLEAYFDDHFHSNTINFDVAGTEIVPPPLSEERQLKLRMYIQKLLNPNSNNSESDISEISKPNVEFESESNFTTNLHIEDEDLTNCESNTHSEISNQNQKSTIYNQNKKSVVKNTVSQSKHSNKKGRKSNSAWK